MSVCKQALYKDIKTQELMPVPSSTHASQDSQAPGAKGAAVNGDEQRGAPTSDRPKYSVVRLAFTLSFFAVWSDTDGDSWSGVPFVDSLAAVLNPLEHVW